MRTHLLGVVALVGCGSHIDMNEVDATAFIDTTLTADAPSQITSPLHLSCAATTPSTPPALCPAAAGSAGHASFCFRPQWPGVTAVEVYVDRGHTGDWGAPFTSLADAGDGTFQATVTLADGTYPYMFRVHGAVDGVVDDGQYLLDQINGAFAPAPDDGAPIPPNRSISMLTVPQPAQTIHHLRGTVVDAAIPQPCFVVVLDVGELYQGHNVLSEHEPANFVESAADGTFDLPVADGPMNINIKYPFALSATYPDPASTPAVGVTRTGPSVAGADVQLDPADIDYDLTGYAALTPSGDTTLPVPFTWSMVAGASTSAVSVSKTNIAGNDPQYQSTYGSATSMSWDGTWSNGTHAATNTTYYWGSWQTRGGPTTTWTSESLLLPITLH